MAEQKNIFREIQGIDSRLKKLENTKQIIGADVVQIASSSIATGTSGSIASGGRVVFTMTLTPTSALLTLWDLFFSFYVDTNGNAAYLYPGGASLSAGQKDLDLQWSFDYLLSSDAIGKRVAKITIINNDASAHEYFLSAKWYGIKQAI